jgi:hypothetical protein
LTLSSGTIIQLRWCGGAIGAVPWEGLPMASIGVRQIFVLASVLAAGVVVGCADRATVRYRPGYAPAPAPAVASAPVYRGPSSGGDYWTTPPPGGYSAPVYSQPAATGPCAPPPCAPPPPPPCEPPPCAPPPPPPCGLPCETGVSNWHVRGVIGFPFQFGTDAGTGCNYWGVDVGTTRCNCWGIDAFFRTASCSDDLNQGGIGPTPSPTARVEAVKFDRDGAGEDGGQFNWVGLKATYEHSISPANRIYGWVGAGPEYFWTNDYLHDDDGFGAFVDAGLGWRFASWGALRLGVDLHADYTSVGRQSPSNDGSERWLFTLAPTLGLEIDF